MKYTRVSKREPFYRLEIPYEKARDIVMATYKNNDMTEDMLSIVNRINCRYSYIEITDNGMALMPGPYNMLPDGVDYDDDGNRIVE